MNDMAIRCTAKTGKGNPCKRPPIKGGTVCATHGGRAPQVKAKAQVIAELSAWRLDDKTDDPGELLLRLMTQARRRADLYALELERRIEQHSGDLVTALTGDAYGEHGKTGEYIRALVQLEGMERDRAANWAAKAIAAGLKERELRLAEHQEDQAIDLLRAALDVLKLPREEEMKVLFAARERMTAITTTSSAVGKS